MLLRSVFSDFPARRMRAPARCMIPPRRGWRTAPIPPSGLRRDPRTFQQSAGLLEPAGTLTGRTCCSHPRWRTGCSFPEDWTKEKRPAFQQGVCVVRPTGFEPAAYRVGVCHSIQLSYEREYLFMKTAFCGSQLRISLRFALKHKVKYTSSISRS